MVIQSVSVEKRPKLLLFATHFRLIALQFIDFIHMFTPSQDTERRKKLKLQIYDEICVNRSIGSVSHTARCMCVPVSRDRWARTFAKYVSLFWFLWLILPSSSTHFYAVHILALLKCKEN